MANILYYPQISMYDKQTKQLLPQADGNINMMRNTINEWKKHRPNDNFFVLIPKNVFIPYYIDLKINCQYITYENNVVSARINRFNFPMNEFISILKDWKFDLIINDIIELTGNFKQLFKIEFNSTPKIISNIRHLDDEINTSYMFRVLDGIMQSDLATILSDSMKNKLNEQFREMIGSCQNLMDKVQVFEPSVSFAEIEPYTYSAKTLNENKVIITFPGRLAKGEERRTNWDKFQEAILKLRDAQQDFEVYLTDPNNSMTEDLKDNLVDWVKTIPKDRNVFLNLLSQTDIIVSLMDIEGFGGISIREALLINCLPIIPYKHEYKKMAPSEAYPGYVRSPIEVDELVQALEWAIQAIKKGNSKRRYGYQAFAKQFTIEEQFKKLLPRIEELL